MKIRPKNWGDFQHYSKRNPPWIKLHKRLLDDFEYQCLPVASKALAPMLWLIASEDGTGLIDAQEAKLAFRLRLTATELAEALKPLLESGFFECVQDASTPIVRRKQDALPERETEAERETEKLSAVADECPFEEFWSGYPVDKNMSRKAAEAVWGRMALDKRKAAVAALPAFKAHCAANKWYRPVHAEKFLADERFEGFAKEDAPTLPALDPSWSKDTVERWEKNLGLVNFRTYFGPAEYIDVDPPILKYRSVQLRRLAEEHFPRVAKEVALEVAA